MLLHDLFRFFVWAPLNGRDCAGISTLHSATFLAQGVIFFAFATFLRMLQAVWWSYKLDEMAAMPELTLQHIEISHTAMAATFFASACTSVLHAPDNANAS